MTKLITFTVNRERFAQVKDSYVRNLNNFKMEQPSSHAVYYSDAIVTDCVWTKTELIEELDELTPEAVEVRYKKQG